MGCNYFNRRFAGFSAEKKRLLAVIYNNVYYCPGCRKLHQMGEEEKHETQ